ncbi:MAG: MBL fold metallo-hydrolase [Pyrinomonadaceae bacterium]
MNLKKFVPILAIAATAFFCVPDLKGNAPKSDRFDELRLRHCESGQFSRDILASESDVIVATGRMSSFTVEKIADGVYALVRKEPASLWFNPNNVIIIGEKDVIVVDSNISSEYTREVLAELKKLTNKPVKYVINTHWHEDHVIGNRVYRDAFPDVQFIGHRSTLTDLPTTGAANRKGSVENGRGLIELLRKQIEKGQDLAGQEITEEARAGYKSDIVLVSSYLSESPKFEIILPNVIVDDLIELRQETRRVEVRFLGKAHTAADLVVYLPKEKIAITGDLIVHPVPLIGSTSYPLEYGATLRKLKALDARKLVPGHGPVLRDTAYLDHMIDLTDAIKIEVEAAAARGETLDQMRKSVDLEKFRKLFAGDSKHKSFVFRNYVTLSAVAAAYRGLHHQKGVEAK